MRLHIFAAGIVACCSVPALGDQTDKPTNIQLNADIFAGSFDPQFADQSFTLYGGAGRANLALAGAWNAQVDIQDQKISSSSFTASEIEQYFHLYRRDSSGYVVGAYGGHGRFDTPYFWIDQLTVGLEAQRYLGPVTLYAQAAYSHLTAAENSADVWMMRGQARWFIDDNTSLSGDLMWARLDAPGEFVADFQTVAATAMHRFANSPFAVFGMTRFDKIVPRMGDGSSAWTTSVGLRVLLDPPSGTLKSGQRTGPAMDVLPIQYLEILGQGS